jgi:peptidoglycan/xylan/chitin deacetylase (PgdA/CDA1 family)
MNNTEPLVSFTFDDFPRSALQRGGQILGEYGALGTFYASFGLMGTVAATGEIFNREDVDLLVAQGHELGCHTFAHCHSWETPTSVFAESLLQNRSALERAVPGAVFTTMSYPISPPRPATKQVTSRLFACCRGGGQRLNAGTIDLNYLSAYFLEKSAGRVDDVKRLIDDTCSVRGWVIFATHDVARRHTPYGCTPEFFEAAVRHASRSGARLATVRGALRALMPHPNSR